MRMCSSRSSKANFSIRVYIGKFSLELRELHTPLQTKRLSHKCQLPEALKVRVFSLSHDYQRANRRYARPTVLLERGPGDDVDV